MDAITMLRNDHKEVERLFKQFEKAAKARSGGGRNLRTVAEQIAQELSRHAAVEEQAFYPAIRAVLPEADDTVLEAFEEHHVVKQTLAELDGMSPDDERFKAKVTVLIEMVRHHVEEEENELFPEVRQALGRKALQELAVTMEEVKRTASARPGAAGTSTGGLDQATAEITRRALQAVGFDSGARAGARESANGRARATTGGARNGGSETGGRGGSAAGGRASATRSTRQTAKSR